MARIKQIIVGLSLAIGFGVCVNQVYFENTPLNAAHQNEKKTNETKSTSSTTEKKKKKKSNGGKTRSYTPPKKDK